MNPQLFLIGLGFIFASVLTNSKKQDSVGAPNAKTVPNHEIEPDPDFVDRSSGNSDGRIGGSNEAARLDSLISSTEQEQSHVE